jgi:hypothetical protein
MPLPSTAAREAARTAMTRRPAVVARFHFDRCENTYGVDPCTAGRLNSGTLQSGGTTTVRLAAGASDVDDFYNGMTFRSTGGTGSGQERKIIDYVGATRDATVSAAFAPALDGTTTYDVIDRPNACVNAFRSCQDQPNYVRGEQVVSFCGRGMPIPVGETIRPYILSVDANATAIDPEKGHAHRARLALDLVDEPGSDFQFDPYADDRVERAEGTVLGRLLARHPNRFGRRVEILRGFVTEPWDWDTFLTERYIIEQIDGPSNGKVRAVLKDPTKLLDRHKIPLPVDGKLVVPLKAIENEGAALCAGADFIDLAAAASAADDAYNGMEVLIEANRGAGQRRVILDYTGATRRATVAPWQVVPDTTSRYAVSDLKIVLTPGRGVQYPNPAVSGKREFARIGDEAIEYTAKSGDDTLTFPDSTHRAVYGTPREDHDVDDGVTLCRQLQGRVKQVVRTLCVEGGMQLADLDEAQLDSEDDTWLGGNYSVDRLIVEPTTPSALLGDLVVYCTAVTYWSPVEQKLKFRVLLPQLPGEIPLWADGVQIFAGSCVKDAREDLRRTQIAVNYALKSATAPLGEMTSYGTTDKEVDGTAQHPNDHSDVRPEVFNCGWFDARNARAIRAFVSRKLTQLRDTPLRLRMRIDPKDYERAPGEQVDLLTRDIQDEITGRAVRTRCMVVRLDDRGRDVAAELRTYPFIGRSGFIAPNDTPDYPDDDVYCHIAENTGLMPDGTEGWRII